MPTVKQKNLFLSLTFWGAVGLFIEGIKPIAIENITQGFSTGIAFDYLGFLVAFMITVLGRYNANSQIFTPKGLPGRDKYSFSKSIKQGGATRS